MISDWFLFDSIDQFLTPNVYVDQVFEFFFLALSLISEKIDFNQYVIEKWSQPTTTTTNENEKQSTRQNH